MCCSKGCRKKKSKKRQTARKKKGTVGIDFELIRATCKLDDDNTTTAIRTLLEDRTKNGYKIIFVASAGEQSRFIDETGILHHLKLSDYVSGFRSSKDNDIWSVVQDLQEFYEYSANTENMDRIRQMLTKRPSELTLFEVTLSDADGVSYDRVDTSSSSCWIKVYSCCFE